MQRINGRAPLLAMLLLSLAACRETDAEIMAPEIEPQLAKGGNGGHNAAGTGIKIAFAVPSLGIHTVSPDGSGYAVVPNTQNGTDPAWSPDRRKLAFTIPSGSAAGLYVVNPNGTQRTRLYTGAAGGAAWSPDGSRIAFHAVTANGTHVFVVNANGTNLQQATAVGSLNNYPTWSGDGSRMAFFSNRYPGAGIWVMNANGTDRRRVRQCTYCSTPTWSPVPGDQRIAYNVWNDGTLVTAAIAVVNADGSLPGENDQVLYSPSHGTTELHPSWSPDAARFVFNSGMLGGGRELISANTNGTGVQRITNTAAQESAAAWAR